MFLVSSRLSETILKLLKLPFAVVFAILMWLCTIPLEYFNLVLSIILCIIIINNKLIKNDLFLNKDIYINYINR